ncbi:unnamed protein product [Lymnaea stagnalis]|uniref:Palmitoyltransferase n=1 Tax=Lymnaea stagnalis TaxID=6523 RepID=A0AAV2H352_LYMST
MINMDNVMDMVSPPVETNNNNAKHSLKLPIFGRVQFVRDREGQMCAAIVLAYWTYGTFIPLFIILIPRYEDGLISLPVFLGFLTVSVLCLLSFFRSSLTNPGRIPEFSAAEDKDSNWSKCRVCNQMRPPRAHHCRRCGQCVMKMDHHCPWINNCVGENNHFAFMQLLFYAFLLGLYTFVLVMLHFWVFPKCVACNREAFYIKHSIWFMYLAFLLSVNMMGMMGVQFCQQHINLISNKTTLEKMINHGGPKNIQGKCYNSYRQICGQGHPIFWLCPIGRRRPLTAQFQYPV